MDLAITVVHVIACFFLIVVVLLQTGKGADIGAVFGGSSQTVFGSGGAANLLTRLTTYTAVIFMVTSLFLTWVSTRSLTLSVADDLPMEPPPLTAPATEPLAPAASEDTSATTSGAAGETAASASADEEPTAAEEPAPEKPGAAAGAADVEEEAQEEKAQMEEEKEEAAGAIAEDTGAALEGAGVPDVDQELEQMDADDAASGAGDAADAPKE